MIDTDALRRRLAAMPLPVVAAPMFLVSGPELLLASCAAGVVGSMPAPNARDPGILDEWLTRITGDLAAMPDAAPWALNLVTHRTNPRLPADLELVDKHKPPIVITALGGPAPAVERVHAYGGLVFADVSNVTYARKAAATGVDGLVLVCAGAGGHTGALCNYVFVDEVRRFFNGYVALAGGIATGRAVFAAEAMGADFAYVGTAFIAATESMANDDYRDMLVACGPEDLLVTKAFTGANASMMKPSIVRMGLDPEVVASQSAKMNYSGLKDAEIKPWKGILSAGQGVGFVERSEPAADIVTRLRREYATARQALARPA